jgi:hypothetical protein
VNSYNVSKDLTIIHVMNIFSKRILKTSPMAIEIFEGNFTDIIEGVSGNFSYVHQSIFH